MSTNQQFDFSKLSGTFEQKKANDTKKHTEDERSNALINNINFLEKQFEKRYSNINN